MLVPWEPDESLGVVARRSRFFAEPAIGSPVSSYEGRGAAGPVLAVLASRIPARSPTPA
ncbi:MAG: hypothetical protein M3304_07320 [Actinomycetota bacterium]|nr:hypothetical protein [Actinomycetota bacterium]